MRPFYLPAQAWLSDAKPDTIADAWAALMADLAWEQRREARKEYFMAPTEGMVYTYGTPPHDESYTSKPWHPNVAEIMEVINGEFETNYNVCFLNRYDNAQQALGWHSDDSPGMRHDHPIAVVSFGEPREIWVREKGAKGVIPKEDRFLLRSGSLFIMPPGFQETHQHRIPKGDRPMGPRVSLTFRRYVPMVTE